MIGTLVLAMTIASVPVSSNDFVGKLEDSWKDSAKAVWRSATVHERDALRDSMRDLLEAAPLCEESRLERVRAGLGRAGFEMSEWQVDTDRIIVVAEREDGRRGGGYYVVRCGQALPIVLQAPHSMFDLRTESIVRKLFAETRVRAAFWNTVHRYRATKDERPEDEVHPADVAHEFGSLFHGATVGASLGDPSLRFVQVHGFGNSAIKFDGIVSSGDADFAPVKVTAALSKQFGKIAAFGEDTVDLGATTNVQGQALAKSGPGRFLHLELSASTREKLDEDPAARAAFMDAVKGPWW